MTDSLKENLRAKETDIASFLQITICLDTEDCELADTAKFHIDPCQTNLIRIETFVSRCSTIVFNRGGQAPRTFFGED